MIGNYVDCGTLEIESSFPFGWLRAEEGAKEEQQIAPPQNSEYIFDDCSFVILV